MLNINFFKPQGPFNLEDLTENAANNGDIKIFDIKTLENASNKDIISGVSTVPLPGHTPGHAGFRVDDGNQSMFHMGDIIHVPNLQLKDPNICTLFDIDPESALKSRKYALDMASDDNLLCTSGHMLDPKFIHIVAPTVWAWRPNRAKKLKNMIDILLCLFPKEPD